MVIRWQNNYDTFEMEDDEEKMAEALEYLNYWKKKVLSNTATAYEIYKYDLDDVANMRKELEEHQKKAKQYYDNDQMKEYNEEGDWIIYWNQRILFCS